MSTTDGNGRPRSAYRSYLAAAVLFVLALLLTAGLASYRDLARAYAHEDTLERDIRETQVRIERLRERIDRIRDDPVLLERLAREDLGMVRPGDVVVVLPEEDAPRP